MPVPALFDRLRAARKLDARRRLNAMAEAFQSARGSQETYEQVRQRLLEAAGVEEQVGSFSDLARDLAGG